MGGIKLLMLPILEVFFFMYDKEHIIETWNKNGYASIQMFSKKEVSELRKEAMRLLVERDPEWDKHGATGSEPYKQPHKHSKLFEKIMRDKRILDIVKTLISNDNNILDCDLQVAQTWMYFKPPGELGRDVHQNIFYSHCDWGTIINISLALNDSDKENGCLYVYPGSHKEKVTYPIPDDWKDEERMKTNPKGWSNERGKPIFIPGTYVDGKWVDMYSKIYLPAKIGSVTFVHSHVLHGSDDNESKDKWRMSFLVGFLKKNSYVHSGDDNLRDDLIDV